MVEAVFGASARGSLRQAQHYGQGPWHHPVFGMVLRSDGQPPSEEGLRAGLLEVVTQAPPDGPAYRRILRRTEAFDRLYAGEMGR